MAFAIPMKEQFLLKLKAACGFFWVKNCTTEKHCHVRARRRNLGRNHRRRLSAYSLAQHKNVYKVGKRALYQSISAPKAGGDVCIELYFQKTHVAALLVLRYRHGSVCFSPKNRALPWKVVSTVKQPPFSSLWDIKDWMPTKWRKRSPPSLLRIVLETSPALFAFHQYNHECANAKEANTTQRHSMTAGRWVQ